MPLAHGKQREHASGVVDGGEQVREKDGEESFVKGRKGRPRGASLWQHGGEQSLHGAPQQHGARNEHHAAGAGALPNKDNEYGEVAHEMRAKGGAGGGLGSHFCSLPFFFWEVEITFFFRTVVHARRGGGGGNSARHAARRSQSGRMFRPVFSSLFCAAATAWLDPVQTTTPSSPFPSSAFPPFLQLHTVPQPLADEFGAKCLDGSPPAMYVLQQDPTKWIIFVS